VDRPWLIAQEPSIVLPASSVADYGRGLAFSTDYSRLYVAWRSPASLAILDVVPDASGVPSNRLVDSIVLGSKPSGLAVAPTGPGGRDLVYVSCYGDDAVWVVDPALRTSIARISMRLGIAEPGQDPRIVRGSPFALATVNVPTRGWQLYAALFAVPPGGSHQVVVVPIGQGAPHLNFADHIVHVGSGGTP
jgi:DNA-binding beta-propeller fold protein YncE